MLYLKKAKLFRCRAFFTALFEIWFSKLLRRLLSAVPHVNISKAELLLELLPISALVGPGARHRHAQ